MQRTSVASVNLTKERADKVFQVLLVEDNPSDAELTVMAFADAHIHAHLTIARDGDRALDLLKGNSDSVQTLCPDLVLLDLNLPRRNGHEVLEEVRRTPSLAHIPIAIFSTSDGEADFNKSYRLGADCHLVKPADYDALITLIQGVGRLWLALSTRRIPAPASSEKTETFLNVSPQATHSNVMSSERPQIHVLLVEDNSSDATLLEHHLALSPDYLFVTRRATRLQEAIQLATTHKVDVAILDLGLPDSQGLASFERFQAACPNLPVVVQSGEDTGQHAVQAVRLGAQDYLPKQSVESYGLSRALIHAIERKATSVERCLLIERERQARHEAEQAVFAKDEFVSIAQHEFRTPITTLALQVERLRIAAGKAEATPLQARVFSVTTRMQMQVERLDRLVGNLLDVTRAGASLKLGRQMTSLTDLLSNTLAGMQGQIEASQSEVSLEAEPKVSGAWDPFRLEQVVVNLISNALKYGKGRPIFISVKGSSDQAVLEVRDKGIGIAAEDCGRIFSRYERAADPGAFEGLGLGLFITRQIVEAHKGTISVESALGAGSTFSVCLPRAGT